MFCATCNKEVSVLEAKKYSPIYSGRKYSQVEIWSDLNLGRPNYPNDRNEIIKVCSECYESYFLGVDKDDAASNIKRHLEYDLDTCRYRVNDANEGKAVFVVGFIFLIVVGFILQRGGFLNLFGVIDIGSYDSVFLGFLIINSIFFLYYQSRSAKWIRREEKLLEINIDHTNELTFKNKKSSENFLFKFRVIKKLIIPSTMGIIAFFYVNRSIPEGITNVEDKGGWKGNSHKRYKFQMDGRKYNVNLPKNGFKFEKYSKVIQKFVNLENIKMVDDLAKEDLSLLAEIHKDKGRHGITKFWRAVDDDGKELYQIMTTSSASVLWGSGPNATIRFRIEGNDIIIREVKPDYWWSKEKAKD